jgi:cytochrome c oxidase subunit II
VFTFLKLADIKNPAASQIDAQGQPVASTSSPGSNLLAATDQPPPPKGASMNIRVDGQQYVWRFRYPGSEDVFSYVDMYVPVGMTITLDITADDVAHSWWIPALGGKADAIPGYTNHTWFQIPGKLAGKVFTGNCAELCGRNHANMTAQVHAVTPSQYEKWLDQRKADIKAADEAAAKQRAQIQKQLP